MFIDFFLRLKAAGLPVSLKEHLTLMEAMDADIPARRVEDFYVVARACLVKDERHLDRFDRVFGEAFKGMETVAGVETAEVPEEWLRSLAERYFSEDDKAQIEALGGFDKLMETLRERLKEQTGRHEGGNRWIGTGGTSPFGSGGYNPEGVRIGDAGARQGRAAKVWEKREFKNLDHDVEIGVRNIKLALRRLRRFARRGAAEEFDLEGTIDATARQGLLDVKMRPERRNLINLLTFFDVGGSMDPYIQVCEELFSAAHAEFKHLEHYYFHNCLYDYVWKDNRRRHDERIDTWDVLRTFGRDYRVIIVGDAAMSPYEVIAPGGASEYFNEEAGAVWISRLTQTFDRIAWLNPTPRVGWEYSASTKIIRELIGDRMYPLTLDGLDRAMSALKA